MMRYTISARIRKQGEGRQLYSIETDTRARAVELGNIFQRNSWEDVKIEVRGKEYLPPFGELP